MVDQHPCTSCGAGSGPCATRRLLSGRCCCPGCSHDHLGLEHHDRVGLEHHDLEHHDNQEPPDAA